MVLYARDKRQMIAMGGTDLAGFKAMLPAMGAVISGMRFHILNLVAEGDAHGGTG